MTKEKTKKPVKQITKKVKSEEEKHELSIQHSKEKDFFEWYPEVVQKAELADYSPVRGCMVIRPYGYAIWEQIKAFLDRRIKEKGHKNAYFPLLIPQTFLQKEANHFQGFSCEVAYIERKKMDEERYALRPTSETIIYDSFSKWIRSWRDLPLKINQWANIVRWETSDTRLFLRTKEFLWQEGHTAHESHGDAILEALDILELYKELSESILAVPVLAGEKTESERFAGAQNTYSIESLMPDGKAIQMGTTHDLGQHFSKVFDIKFRDKDQEEKYVWQTSWGVSTRLIGSVIMIHGDDKGLVLPPKIAPIQVVIVPVVFDETKKTVIAHAKSAEKQIKDFFRTELDDRDEYTAGWKFNYWEMKGVPLRIEVGPKDIAKGEVVLVRRDTGKKRAVLAKNIKDEVVKVISDIQESLLENSRKKMNDNIVSAKSYKELFDQIKNKKMVKASWCGRTECELEIKDKTGATIRLIEEKKKASGSCVHCNQKPVKVVYFAKAY